ncbi:MAG: hypothetical protein AAFW95_09890 [Cyanobacteria bacterium J06638_6]
MVKLQCNDPGFARGGGLCPQRSGHRYTAPSKYLDSGCLNSESINDSHHGDPTQQVAQHHLYW